jgi:hypothetical protein
MRNSSHVDHVNRGWQLKKSGERYDSYRTSGLRPVIGTQQARQGVTGHNVRLILGFSMAAVVLVFAIIWIVYFA